MERTLKPPVIYQPKHRENQIAKFQKFVEKKYGIKFDDYWHLHEWSYKNFPEFWGCVWDFFGTVYSKPYTEVFDRKRSFDNMEWFKGARLNYTENIFKHRDSHTALIIADSTDNAECITYRQLYEEVCQYASSLKSLGVKKGDVIACFMSNKKEAVFGYLATASLGAIWCGALPMLGVKALLARFKQISPKVIFTSGDFSFEGNDIKMIPKIREVVTELPSVGKVIFVPSCIPGIVENIESIPKCITITDFLLETRKAYQSKPWDLEYEQLPFDYPLHISFTSGTTGLPKGIFHSAGAYFASLKDYGLHLDITRKDVLLNFSPVGWISWNMYINTLQLGTTLCLYHGSPFEESPTRFWDIIDKFGLTSLYIWSSTAEDLEKKGYLPTQKHSLATLKQIFAIGSVMKPHTHDFLAGLKPGLFVDSAYGTTEVYGLISGVNSNLPVYRGELQCFSLGMDVKCLDEKGKEIVGKRGELVLANPMPAMPITLLHDDDKQKVRSLYLNRFPGYWCVSDDMWINPETKGFILYGRSDETLNPKGARFSCAEIYFALDGFPDLLDCTCVSQYNSDMDERVVLFLKMKQGITLTEFIKQQIREVIERNLSYEHVPDIIMQVPDIPYNLTGKKLNILVKKLINKMAVQNLEYVINPECIDFYKKLDLGEF